MYFGIVAAFDGDFVDLIKYITGNCGDRVCDSILYAETIRSDAGGPESDGQIFTPVDTIA